MRDVWWMAFIKEHCMIGRLSPLKLMATEFAPISWLIRISWIDPLFFLFLISFIFIFALIMCHDHVAGSRYNRHCITVRMQTNNHVTSPTMKSICSYFSMPLFPYQFNCLLLLILFLIFFYIITFNWLSLCYFLLLSMLLLIL